MTRFRHALNQALTKAMTRPCHGCATPESHTHHLTRFGRFRLAYWGLTGGLPHP